MDDEALKEIYEKRMEKQIKGCSCDCHSRTGQGWVCCERCVKLEVKE